MDFMYLENPCEGWKRSIDKRSSFSELMSFPSSLRCEHELLSNSAWTAYKETSTSPNYVTFMYMLNHKKYSLQ